MQQPIIPLSQTGPNIRPITTIVIYWTIALREKRLMIMETTILDCSFSPGMSN